MIFKSKAIGVRIAESRRREYKKSKADYVYGGKNKIWFFWALLCGYGYLPFRFFAPTNWIYDNIFVANIATVWFFLFFWGIYWMHQFFKRYKQVDDEANDIYERILAGRK